MKKTKIINLDETSFNMVENKINKDKNLEIITAKDNFENLKIDFQDADVIFLVLNTDFEDKKDTALKIIENAKENVFTGIFDTGNGDTSSFDSKVNFILKCSNAEEIKISINGIISSLGNRGIIDTDLDDLKNFFEKTSKVSFIFETGNLENFEEFLENLKVKLESLKNKNQKKKIYFSITAGPAVSLFNIHSISAEISNILNSETMIWNYLLNEENKENLEITAYTV